MADQEAVDRLYKSVKRAVQFDPTLGVYERPYIERWVSDLSPWQVNILKTRAKLIDSKKDRDVWFALLGKVVRFYQVADRYNGVFEFLRTRIFVQDHADMVHAIVWRARNPSDIKPNSELSKAVHKTLLSQVDGEDSSVFKGIYAPLQKFYTADIKNHWTENVTSFDNVPPSHPFVQDLVRQLNRITPGPTPLATIREYLRILTDTSFHVTTFAMEHFRYTVGSLNQLPSGSRIRIPLRLIRWNSDAHQRACHHPWFSCDVISMLILSLAAPAPMLSSLRNLAPGMADPELKPNPFKDIRVAELTPSQSLRTAFEYAKIAAFSPQKLTTVLMVSLVDTEHWRLPYYPDMELQRVKCEAREYMALTHFFALGFEPEGMTMWQSWKHMGPRITDHVALGGAKVRSWEEAGEFVATFEDLVKRDVGKVSLNVFLLLYAWKPVITRGFGHRHFPQSRTSNIGSCSESISSTFSRTIPMFAARRCCLSFCLGLRFGW